MNERLEAFDTFQDLIDLKKSVTSTNKTTSVIEREIYPSIYQKIFEKLETRLERAIAHSNERYVTQKVLDFRVKELSDSIHDQRDYATHVGNKFDPIEADI